MISETFLTRTKDTMCNNDTQFFISIILRGGMNEHGIYILRKELHIKRKLNVASCDHSRHFCAVLIEWCSS